MNGPFLVQLKISTFIGLSVGAKHYYGKLHVFSKSDKNGTVRGGYGAWRHPHDGKEVTYIVNEDQSNQFKELKDDWAPEEGDKSSRFWDKKSLIIHAVEMFNGLFDPTDLLVMDNRHDVSSALAGALKDKYNEEPIHTQWKFLDKNGFLKDKTFEHSRTQ